MTAARSPISALGRLRGWAAGLPLRVRLVAAMLALVVAALAMVGAGAGTALRAYLLDRVDTQLMGIAIGLARQVAEDAGPGRPPGDVRLPPEYYLVAVDPDGNAVVVAGGPSGTAPALPTLTAAQVADRAGTPFTVGPATGSGSWRLAALPPADGDRPRPLERRPVDLLALAADAVHDARAVAPDRTIRLTLAGGPAPPVVTGDEAGLRQVLANLVGNALVHTPAGTPVAVTVRTRPGSVVLEVADRGPGLAAADAERVFERFYRADPSRARASGGTGLGLSIVAALTAAHGGTVGVDSRPGAGTTFRVILPAAEVPAQAFTAVAQSRQRQGSSAPSRLGAADVPDRTEPTS